MLCRAAFGRTDSISYSDQERFIRRTHVLFLSWRFAAIAATVILAAAATQSQSISGTVLDPTGAVVRMQRLKSIIRSADTIAQPIPTPLGSSASRMFRKTPITCRYRRGIRSLCPGRGDSFRRADRDPIKLRVAGSTTAVTVEAGGDLVENRFDFSHGCGQELVRQTSAGKPVIVAQFTGHSGHGRSRGGFERAVSRPGRSRGKLVLARRPAHHRPAKQSLLQPGSSGLRTVAGSIPGAPPAEYGGKTSLIINVTTRSGQGMTTPHGDVTASYGSFGTANAGIQLRLRRPEMGELYQRERAEQRTVPRSAGVRGHA